MPQTYPARGEDKYIMAERDKLEAIWRNVLDDDQRAAWLDYWNDFPPVDIYGRQYITTEPTSWPQMQVAPAHAYAWQNIFATYRFKLAPVLEPLTRVATVIDTITPTTVGSTLKLALTVDAPPDGEVPVIFYASAAHAPLQGSGKQRVRPITWALTASPATTWDVTDAYDARHGAFAPGIITTAAGTIDNNNALAPCGEYPDIESPS